MLHAFIMKVGVKLIVLGEFNKFALFHNSIEIEQKNVKQTDN